MSKMTRQRKRSRLAGGLVAGGFFHSRARGKAGVLQALAAANHGRKIFAAFLKPVFLQFCRGPGDKNVSRLGMANIFQIYSIS
jgi:hypothetical protein